MEKKKIGTLSAILFVFGTTVGSGIFIKNGSILSNVNGNIGMFIGA
jgi:hypothetical protein